MRTCCRYVWCDSAVEAARQQLYRNLATAGEENETVVLRAISESIAKYYQEFGVAGTLERMAQALRRAVPDS